MSITALALALACVLPAPSAPELRVGITLHAYGSWTAAVVGDTPVEVRAILPAGLDAATYQPRPEEVRRLADLDAVIVNGLGHDTFVDALLKAAARPALRVIAPGRDLPLIQGAHGEAINPHTFLSFGLAIRQTHAIADALAELAPRHAATFRKNARAYAGQLRALRADAEQRLKDVRTRRVVTVHDGYGYLLQELGLEVVAVVEPAHGVVPSAKEVAILIDLLKRERVDVLLTEDRFPPAIVDLLRAQAGVRVGVLSHVASGEHGADKFVREMRGNVDVLASLLGGRP